MRTIGIIGAGRIGSGVARLAVNAGLRVVLSSRHPEALSGLVREFGPGARAGTVTDAGDVVAVSVPLSAYRELPVAELAGRTVLDTMNYYPDRDEHVAELDDGSLTSTALVQRHLAGSGVVKAFNSIDFVRLVSLARPHGATDRSALPVAGDDPGAVTVAIEVLDLLGYDAVSIGPLEASWRAEPGTPVYVQPYLPARPEELEAEQMAQWFMTAEGVPTPASEVASLLNSATRRAAGDARATLG